MRLHKVRGWISLTFLGENTSTSLPLNDSFLWTDCPFLILSFPSLMFRQTVFFARFGQIQYAAGNTAIWKHKLQSHVPLLYSSSTCYLTAKISKLAYSKPVSREYRQGLATKATDKTSHSCRVTGAYTSCSLIAAALWSNIFSMCAHA